MANDVSKLFDKLQAAVATAEKKQKARDAEQESYYARVAAATLAFESERASAQLAFDAAQVEFQRSSDAVDALRSELKGVLDTLLPNSNPRVKVSG